MCARKETFKYFFDRAEVQTIWERLSANMGAIKRSDTMKTMEIETRALIVRATLLGNPITVFRKRACTAADVAAFDALVGFSPGEQGCGS